MKNDNTIELVLLLSGNFVVIPILESLKDSTAKSLREFTIPGKCDYVDLADVTVLAKSIVGWYFRKKIESPTKQMMEFLDKKIPNSDEGDEWKK